MPLRRSTGVAYGLNHLVRPSVRCPPLTLQLNGRDTHERTPEANNTSSTDTAGTQLTILPVTQPVASAVAQPATQLVTQLATQLPLTELHDAEECPSYVGFLTAHITDEAGRGDTVTEPAKPE